MPVSTTISKSPAEQRETSLHGTLAFYENRADEFCRKTAAADLNETYRPFLSTLHKGATILDAGCGSGRDARAFLEKGFRVKAFDASPKVAEIASRYIGQPCDVLSFEQMDYNQEFDGIWACASLLHVSHGAMPKTLDRLAKALKPKGTLFVSLKEGEGESIANDGRFFSYFRAQEFKKLLTSHRFQLVKTWKQNAPDSSGTICTWLNFLARKSPSL